VINTRGGLPGVSAWRLGILAAISCGLFLLTAPGGASASYAKCHGSLAPDNGVNISAPGAVDYTFYCNHVIHAYTIFSTSSIDLFSAGPLVYAGKDPSTADVDGNGGFTCEGFIPSHGIGCNGTTIPGTSPPKQGGTTARDEAVVGQVVPEAKLCARHHQPRPKVFVSILETQFDTTGHPYQTSSGPFRLFNGCQKAAQSHPRHHHNNHR
jgi:hypothetical protein